jgi:hypothetical protein
MYWYMRCKCQTVFHLLRHEKVPKAQKEFTGMSELAPVAPETEDEEEEELVEKVVAEVGEEEVGEMGEVLTEKWAKKVHIKRPEDKWKPAWTLETLKTKCKAAKKNHVSYQVCRLENL